MLQLEQEIERLRSNMIEEADRQDSLTHDKVVAISQQLDECLLLLHRKMATSSCKRKIHIIDRFRISTPSISFRDYDHRPIG